jgi:membrane protease YdiL (CAAX protease family)
MHTFPQRFDQRGLTMQGTDIFAPRTENHRRTWTLATVALMVAFLLVGTLAAIPLWNLSGLGAPLTFDPAIDAKTSTPYREAFGIGASFALALIPLFLWIWFFERGRLDAIGLRSNPISPFFGGFFGGLASVSIVILAITLLGGYSVEATGAWQAPSMASLAPIAAFGLAFILQGSTEEIFVRGWIMQIASSRYGVTAGIIFSTLVFSVLHGGNIEPSAELVVALLNIVLVGAFLAIWAINQGHLWGVCGWHASWNWLMSTGFGLEVSGIKLDTGALIVDLASISSVPWWITGGKFGPEASLVTTAFLAVACAWALARVKRAG